MSNGTVLNVSELIDRRRPGRFQILVFILCGFTQLLDGIDVQSIAPTVVALAKHLHVPFSAFGAVFGITQVGFLIGALAFGPVADRLGRKWPLVCAMFVFGFTMLLTPVVTTFSSLLFVRFFVGLGLGGACVSTVALVTEYAPRSVRANAVTALWAAMPLGGTIVGLAGAAVIPTLGWQWIFYFGGALPLIIVALMIPLLPESLKFLVARDAAVERIASIVAKIAPEVTVAPGQRFTLDEEKLAGVPVKHLFTEGRTAMTIFLWGASFMGWVILIVSGSWLPVLMQQTGYSVSQAALILASYNLFGTVSMATIGRVIDRSGPYTVISVAFGLGALAMALFGFISSPFILALGLAGIAGILTQGATAGVIALSAASYPVSVRSTGVGWALGIGRIGGVVAPFAAGNLIALNFRAGGILAAVALPCLCGMLCVIFMRWSTRRKPAVFDEARLVSQS